MQTAAQPVPQSLPQLATSGVPGRILALAPALARALGEAGGNTQATVGGRLPDGGTVLTTAHGDITLKLQALLKPGLNVLLTLPQNPAPNMAALVLPARTRNPTQQEQLPPASGQTQAPQSSKPLPEAASSRRPIPPTPSTNARSATAKAPPLPTPSRPSLPASPAITETLSASKRLAPIAPSVSPLTPRLNIPSLEALAKASIAIPKTAATAEQPRLAPRRILQQPSPVPVAGTQAAEPPKARVLPTPLTLAQQSPDSQATNIPKRDGASPILSTEYARDRIQKFVSQDALVARYLQLGTARPSVLLAAASPAEKIALTTYPQQRPAANAPVLADTAKPTHLQSTPMPPSPTPVRALSSDERGLGAQKKGREPNVFPVRSENSAQRVSVPSDQPTIRNQQSSSPPQTLPQLNAASSNLSGPQTPKPDVMPPAPAGDNTPRGQVTPHNRDSRPATLQNAPPQQQANKDQSIENTARVPITAESSNSAKKPALTHINHIPMTQITAAETTARAVSRPLEINASGAPRALAAQPSLPERTIPTQATLPSQASIDGQPSQKGTVTVQSEAGPKTSLPQLQPGMQPPAATRSDILLQDIPVGRPIPPQPITPAALVPTDNASPPTERPPTSIPNETPPLFGEKPPATQPLPKPIQPLTTEAFLRPTLSATPPLNPERPQLPTPQPPPSGTANAPNASVQASPSYILNAPTLSSTSAQTATATTPSLTLLTPSPEMQAIVQVLTRPPGTEAVEFIRTLQTISADLTVASVDASVDEPGADPPDLCLDLIASSLNQSMGALEDGAADPTLKNGDEALIAEAELSVLGFFRLETREMLGGFTVIIRHAEPLDADGLETLGGAAMAEAERYGVRARVRFVHDPELDHSL